MVIGAVKDYYKVLMVDREADQQVIEAAYRVLAKKHHPDVNTATDSHDRMVEIQEAKEVLCDPAKRAQYDAACKGELEYDPFSDEYNPRAEMNIEPSPPAQPEPNAHAFSAASFLYQGGQGEEAELLARCEIRFIPASHWTDETGWNSWHPDTFEVFGQRKDYEALGDESVRDEVRKAFLAATGSDQVDIVPRFSPEPKQQDWHERFSKMKAPR